MTTTSPSAPAVDASRSVLSSLRHARTAASAWEVETARLVAAWVAEHAIPDAGPESTERVIGPDEPIERPALAGLEAPMQLAGPGAPLVPDLEFCEVAATLCMSPDAARGYVGEVTELAFRLPHLWDRVSSGQVRLWRAREVARGTRILPPDGAAWVDAQLAPVIGSCSGAQVQRAVAAALDRFDPEAAEARRREADEHRHFDIHLDEPEGPDLVGAAGTAAVEGVIDLADTLDLDAAVAASAAQLQALGSIESLDARRARAVGEIARRYLMLPLPSAERTESDPESAGPPPVSRSEGVVEQLSDVDGQRPDMNGGSLDVRAPVPGDPGRRIELVLHLGVDALNPALDPALESGPGSGAVGRCENTRSPVSAEQIRAWCGSPGTKVLVRPVVDLAGHYPAECYEIPGRLRRQVATRDPHCVFPSCTRRARACDLDHIVPFEQGGPTCGCNLAPLCRRHHRAKTHGSWSYVMVTPGTYLWTSPGGELWFVDGRGTFAVPTRVPSHAAPDTPCGHAAHRDRSEPPDRPISDPARSAPAANTQPGGTQVHGTQVHGTQVDPAPRADRPAIDEWLDPPPF